ncbi:MAG: glycosyltransferase [Conexivisphaerales archaeon]
MSLAVVVPTLEEQGNISRLMTRLKQVRDELECEFFLVFVNDEGRDYTSHLLSYFEKRYDFVRVIKRDRRRGLASAYFEGLRYAITKLDCDFVIQMDADLQHPPEKIIDMYRKLNDGYEVVIASRFVNGSSVSGNRMMRILLAKLFCYITNILLNLRVRDSTSGFRGMRRKAALAILRQHLLSKGFAYQLETLCSFRRNRFSIAEIPFHFSPRTNGKSKLFVFNMVEFMKCLLYSAFFDSRF